MDSTYYITQSQSRIQVQSTTLLQPSLQSHSTIQFHPHIQSQYRKSRLWKWISEYALFNSDMSAYLRYCFMYRTYPIHIVFSFMSVQIEKKNCFIINFLRKSLVPHHSYTKFLFASSSRSSNLVQIRTGIPQIRTKND